MILAPNNILRKGKLLAALMLLTVSNLFAQELNDPVATHYLADNPFVLSPTYAGIGDNIRIRVNGFSQWVGIKDAPQNQALYADFRIFEQSGLGLSLYNDKNGNTRQTGAKLTFAHHIILDYPSRQYLSFGLSYNFNNFKVDVDKIKFQQLTNDRYTANDNFDVGLLYRNKSFWINFNASNLLNKDIKNYFKEEPNLLRFYQVYTGFTYRSYRDSKVEIEPSAYFQHFESDGRSFLDLNAKLRYYDNQRTGYFWLGATYRMLIDQPFKPLTVGPMLGIKKGGFYAGYSYQMFTNELSSHNSGTHMITLGWDFFQGLSNCPCTQSSLAVD